MSEHAETSVDDERQTLVDASEDASQDTPASDESAGVEESDGLASRLSKQVGQLRRSFFTDSVALKVVTAITIIIAVAGIAVAVFTLIRANATDARTSRLETSLNNLTNDIKNIDANINKLKADIGGESTGKLIQEIEDLTGKVGTLENEFDVLKGKAGAESATLERLQTGLSTLTSRQTSLAGEVAKTENQLNLMKQDVSELNSRIGGFQSKIDSAENGLRTAVTKIENAMESSERKLTSALNEVNSKVATAQQELSRTITNANNELEQKVAKIRSDVNTASSELEQKVAKIRSDVDQVVALKANDLVAAKAAAAKSLTIQDLNVEKINFTHGGTSTIGAMGVTAIPGELHFTSNVKDKGERVVGFLKYQPDVDPGSLYLAGGVSEGKIRTLKEHTCQPFDFC